MKHYNFNRSSRRGGIIPTDFLPNRRKRYGNVAVLMIFIMMVTSGMTIALYKTSNVERAISGTNAVEGQLVALAQAGVERVTKEINDEMNLHLNGGSSWRDNKSRLFKEIYKPTAMSLFYDLPKGKSYVNELEAIDQELSTKVPGIRVDVKYELARVVPLGGKISVKSLFQRHFPYINREKQATIVITAVATDGKVSRQIRAQKELKVIDSTPPNATSAFTFDQVSQNVEGRDSIPSNSAYPEGNNRMNTAYNDVKAERENKITNNDILNGGGGAFPFSAKGYLAVEGWDTGAIKSFADLKGSKGALLEKFIFLPRGAVTLLSQDNEQFRKRANLVEWLSNVAPSKQAIKLKDFFFPDPFLEFAWQTPWVGFKVFGKKITIFPSKRVVIFRINPMKIPISSIMEGANMNVGGLGDSKKLGGGNSEFGSEGFGFSIKSFIKDAFKKLLDKIIGVFTKFGGGNAEDALDEEGGVKNFNIWEYKEGNVWALPKLWHNNGHLWGSIVDPKQVKNAGDAIGAIKDLVSANGSTSKFNDGGFTLVVQSLLDLVPAEKLKQIKESGFGDFKFGNLMNAALYPKFEGNTSTSYFQFMWVPIVIIPGVNIPIPIVDLQALSRALTGLVQLLMDWQIWTTVVLDAIIGTLKPFLFNIINPFKWVQAIWNGAKAFWNFIKDRVREVLEALLNAKSVYGNFSNGDKKTSESAVDDDADIPNMRNKEPVNASWETELWKARAAFKFKGETLFDGATKPMKLDGVYFVDGDVKIKGDFLGKGTIVSTGDITVLDDVKSVGGGADKEAPKLSLISMKKLIPAKSYALVQASVMAAEGLAGDVNKKLKIHGNLVVDKLQKERMRLAVVFDSNIVNRPVDLKSWFEPWSNQKAVFSDGFASYQVSNK